MTDAEIEEIFNCSNLQAHQQKSKDHERTSQQMEFWCEGVLHEKKEFKSDKMKSMFSFLSYQPETQVWWVKPLTA